MYASVRGIDADTASAPQSTVLWGDQPALGWLHWTSSTMREAEAVRDLLMGIDFDSLFTVFCRNYHPLT